MSQTRIYPGIDNDKYAGMTDVGKIIRDAWLFGVLPETETCENWDYGRLEALYDKVHTQWLKHGHLVSQLPPDLQQRHAEIHRQAYDKARAQGWDMDLSDEQ